MMEKRAWMPRRGRMATSRKGILKVVIGLMPERSGQFSFETVEYRGEAECFVESNKAGEI